MKKIFFVSLLCMVIVLFVACGPDMVQLKSVPEDYVLLSTVGNNSVEVAFSFESDIPEILELDKEYKFEIVNSIKKNIESYLLTKFGQFIGENKNFVQGTRLEFVVKSFEVDYEIYREGMEKLTNFVYGIKNGDVIATAKMTISLGIYENGEIVQNKTFISNSEKNGVESSEKYLLADVINDCVSKGLIMIDKYLVSVGY